MRSLFPATVLFFAVSVVALGKSHPIFMASMAAASVTVWLMVMYGYRALHLERRHGR